MKKILAIILSIAMILSMAACGSSASSSESEATPSTSADSSNSSASDGNSDSTSEVEAETEVEAEAASTDTELVRWKLGMMDPGAWNATQGPLYSQMELACEALNVELMYVAADSNSAEGHLAAVQSMIAGGCDGIILLNMPLVHGIIPQVAQLCDEAGVYWSLAWTKISEGEANYDACMNSEYFVSTTYEDDVYSANWCASLLGEMGCKELTEIGFTAGNATGDMRDEGIRQGCEEYGMTILAEERDTAVTTSSEGGKTTMDRFIVTYPEMDGLIIAGMSQLVLSGVVSSMEENNVGDSIGLACIDFHEYQTEYLESGILDGIIGGHVVGTLYSLVLMANIMNGTPLTDEKAVLQDNFIELTSGEDAAIWDTYGKPGQIYSAEEIQNMMVKINPDYNYETFLQMIADYSLDDIVARANAN